MGLIIRYHLPEGTASLGLPVRFVHNGFAIVGGSDDGKIRLWSTESKDRMQSLQQCEHFGYSCVTIYHDAPTLVDGKIKGIIVSQFVTSAVPKDVNSDAGSC